MSERQDQAINSERGPRAEGRVWKEGQGRGLRAVASREGQRTPSCPGHAGALGP